MRMWVAGLALACVVVLAACEPVTYVELPKPAEADPQFVLERSMLSNKHPNIYVFRDKVNGNILYLTGQGGIAVSGGGFVEEEKKED